MSLRRKREKGIDRVKREGRREIERKSAKGSER